MGGAAVVHGIKQGDIEGASATNFRQSNSILVSQDSRLNSTLRSSCGYTLAKQKKKEDKKKRKRYESL